VPEKRDENSMRREVYPDPNASEASGSLSSRAKEGKDMANIKTYVEESYNELVNKVSWPTWAELQNSTSIVAIASVIIALMIFVMDFAFGINGGEDTVWKGVLGFFYELF